MKRITFIALISFTIGIAVGHMAWPRRSGKASKRYDIRMLGGTVPMRIDRQNGTAEILPITRADGSPPATFDEIVVPQKPK